MRKEIVRSKNTPERRKVLLSDVRIDKTKDSGGFTAYGNVKGYLDTHGTIMWHGCYLRCLPDLIKKGFVPDTHGAASGYTTTNNTILAYINDAKEDDYGLLITATFHSTPTAQDSRTIFEERINAGKECGNSIGFKILDYFTIMPKDYDTLIPKYSLPEFIEQNLERARTMYCVDVCTEIEVFESSLTLIPSNEVSLVEEIRGKKSNITVTPNGDLFFRTKTFQNFIKEAESVLSKMSILDVAEQSALAAELPIINSSVIKDIIKMAEQIRGKRDDDAKMDDCRDAYDDVKRAFGKLAKHNDDMGEMHRDLMDKHEDGKKLHRDAKKALDTLSKHLSKRDDDDDEEKPEKDKDKRSARTILSQYDN